MNISNVELRHFVALEAVGRTRSFAAAARELGYTQSAVSQQIARLERAVGQRLVDRPGGPRPVSLTEAGALLLRHADAIVARLDAAQADMDALAEGAAGPLRVGILQSVGARILPRLLRRFREEWPRVEVRVREETAPLELLRLLEHGELDLTFADLPVPDGPFAWNEILRDPYVLLVPAGDPLAGRDAAPPLRELSGLPLISWRQLGEPETYLRGRVPDLNVVFRSDDNGTVVGLVAEGLGYAVVPQLVVNPRNPAYVALPFGNRIPPRHLAIVWHRDRYRSAAAEAFIESSSDSAASTSRPPGR
ncbi:MAG TPA: LysR family transcriptional regulator [Gaiellaceae bacterium]|nr:LysR family transcriptional regulator [Gaiellaceae bacterium]